MPKYMNDFKTVDIFNLSLCKEETKTIESALPQYPSQYKPNPKQWAAGNLSFRIYNELAHKFFQL